jgi:GT2 family glycosyltransferase
MVQSESKAFFSIIIPTFRRFAPLIRTVQDLLKQDYCEFEIIVADQNPAWPPELFESLRQLKSDSRVRWVNLESPGVVVARNRAVANSQGDLLLFVDDDVVVPYRGFLHNHARNFEDSGIAAVVGRERRIGDPEPKEGTTQLRQPLYLPAPERLSPLQQALWFDRNGDQAQKVCTFCTCNSAVRRSAFLAIGGFDELFTGNSYGDDYDLALRLHQKGFQIVYDPSSWLIHTRAPMGGLRLTDRSNKVDTAATARGLWLFVLRHGHRGMYYHLLVHHVLRKTLLIKQNLFRVWHQLITAAKIAIALPLAYRSLRQGPKSIFSSSR